MQCCDRLPTCPFFNDNMQKLHEKAEYYKAKYCQGHFQACARHLVANALTPERVPSNLYPNELSTALALIVAG